MQAQWQTHPENIEAYRRALLAEENRLRPWGEILFCELRLAAEADERVASRLSRPVAPWPAQTEAAGLVSGPSPTMLRTALRGLAPRSRAILRLHARGTTQGAIAQRYGLSPQRVSQILQAALQQAQKNVRPRNQGLRRKAP